MCALMTILVGVALSGCVVEPQDTIGDAGISHEPETSQVLAWGLEECVHVVWFAPADSKVLEQHLPNGFELAGGAFMRGLDTLTGLDTYLGFEAFECRSGVGLNGTVESLVYGGFFTRVAPPEEFTIDGIENQYYVKWDVLVPDESRFLHFSGHGLPVRTGNVQVDAPAVGDSPGIWQATLTLEGLGTFSFSGATTDAETPRDDVPFAEFTTADGGVATWQATSTNSSSASGRGTWTVEPGSWAADVLGAERGVGAFNVGVWSFTDGTIRLPNASSQGES